MRGGALASFNPAASRHFKKPKSRQRLNPFESQEQVNAVAACFKNVRDQALVLFVCATGLRPQEWQALQYDAIDRKNRSLTVTHKIQRGKGRVEGGKTEGSVRRVELSDQALAALDLLPTPFDRTQLVFPGTHNGILDVHAWSRQGSRPGPWTKALADAGLEYRSPDQMRHTHATLALAEGDVSPDWLAKQMGHSSVAMIEKHYRKWLTTDTRNIDRLNAAYAKQTGIKSASGAKAAGQ